MSTKSEEKTVRRTVHRIGTALVVGCVVLMLVAMGVCGCESTEHAAVSLITAPTSVLAVDPTTTTTTAPPETTTTEEPDPSEAAAGTSTTLAEADALEDAPTLDRRHMPHVIPLDPDDVVVWRVKTSEKVVALTFDDGPSEYTPLIMAALQEADVPATFFCIGQHAQVDPGQVDALKAAGFEVENHTWDHRIQLHLSAETIRKEIQATEAVVGPTKYFRPPAGYYNDRIREVVASLGMMLIRWDVDSRDWQHQDVEWILSRVKSAVRPGSIVLMHDGGGDRSQTAAALPELISWLRSKGYEFVTIDQLVTGGYGKPVGKT
jgi:peptidoglycan/xylan/chitin deacetylase (PgdA/CDA1 family)